MKVDVVLRKPGSRPLIGTYAMDSVPRASDLVEIAGIVRLVHEVTWSPENKSVTLLLRATSDDE